MEATSAAWMPKRAAYGCRNEITVGKRVSCWVRDRNDRDRKLVYITYLRDVSNLIIIHLPDIVIHYIFHRFPGRIRDLFIGMKQSIHTTDRY